MINICLVPRGGELPLTKLQQVGMKFAIDLILLPRASPCQISGKYEAALLLQFLFTEYKCGEGLSIYLYKEIYKGRKTSWMLTDELRQTPKYSTTLCFIYQWQV